MKIRVSLDRLSLYELQEARKEIDKEISKRLN